MKFSLDKIKANILSVHGNKYNLEYFTHKTPNEKGKVLCNVCGNEFYMTYRDLYSGHGCPYCKSSKLSKQFSKNTENFIEECKKIHGDKYDYSKVNYKNNKTKVEIICKKHGSFWQMPTNHLNKKQGCPICNGTKILGTDEFIKLANIVHNNTYNYDKTKYVNRDTEVEIECLKHGIFYQKPYKHLMGQGCPICKISHLETEVINVLNELKIDFRLHDRTILNGLEIDFYLPKQNIAIECQGIQHFKPIMLFGGEKQLLEQIQRDINKNKILTEKNINIIYYTNFIDETKKYNFYNDTNVFSTIELLKTFLQNI